MLASPGLLEPAEELLSSGLQSVFLLLESELLGLKGADVLGGLLQDDHLCRLVVVRQLGHLVAQSQEARAQVVSPLALQDVVVAPAFAVLRVGASRAAGIALPHALSWYTVSRGVRGRALVLASA